MTSDIIRTGEHWFQDQGWVPFPFQLESWRSYLEGYSGLVNAPTGSGKTYSLLMPVLLEFLRDHPDVKKNKDIGLQAIWITPIRALSKEIEISANRLVEGLELPWKIGVRSGDTT